MRGIFQQKIKWASELYWCFNLHKLYCLTNNLYRTNFNIYLFTYINIGQQYIFIITCFIELKMRLILFKFLKYYAPDFCIWFFHCLWRISRRSWNTKSSRLLLILIILFAYLRDNVWFFSSLRSPMLYRTANQSSIYYKEK